jgi:hypothetical protein
LNPEHIDPDEISGIQKRIGFMEERTELGEAQERGEERHEAQLTVAYTEIDEANAKTAQLQNRTEKLVRKLAAACPQL